jgi:CheY-like chemotaxis protein
MRPKPLHVLLVEDDEIDAEAVFRAFQRQQLPYTLTTAPDGLEALHMLRGQNGYNSLCQPHLILLDLNMPRMNGVKFLQALRDDPDLKQTIVFVLTTSNRDEDKLAAYDKQVAGYLLKSKVGTDFANLIALLNCYQQTVEFPPEKSTP